MNRYTGVNWSTTTSEFEPIYAHVPIHAHPQFSLRFIVFGGKYVYHVIDIDKAYTLVIYNVNVFD